MRLAVGFALVGVCLAGCAGATPVPEAPRALRAVDLYPLRDGSAWSYDVDAGDGDPVLAISRVVSVNGTIIEVATGDGVVRYELRPGGIYRSGKGSWLLREPIDAGASWQSGPEMTARIASVAVRIETSAGAFEGCVRVEEGGAASGQEIRTVYCPDVGPVEVVSEMQVREQRVRVRATLRGYQIGTP